MRTVLHQSAACRNRIGAHPLPGHRRRHALRTAGYTKDGERVEAGIRYRIRFTTSKPVFRLPRKLARLKTDTRSTQDWLYITSCEPTGRTEPVRCLNVATDDHLFLMAGSVPTHNSSHHQ